MKQTKLTEDQVKVLETEYAELFEAGRKMVTEHKMWLRLQLAGLDFKKLGVGWETFEHLVAQTSEIAMEVVQLREVGGKATIAMTCSYPDALHAFLSRDDIPPVLQLVASGGITLDEP